MRLIMKQFKFISHSEKETIDFAKKLATNLKIGDIVVLNGDLGSGKTKFTEGILSFYGLENEISSPTFTIVNEYKKDDLSIFHFDVYRLEDVDEFYEIGGDEYFDKGICVIEWGKFISDALPSNYIEIDFEKDNENINNRILTIKTYGNQYDSYFKEEF